MRLIKDYGLGIFIIALFLASWTGHGYFEYLDVMSEAKEHGQPFLMSDFWISFWRSTLENWQSEWLQVATLVIATKYLIYKGSAESRDSDDRLEAKVDDILNRLDRLEK